MHPLSASVIGALALLLTVSLQARDLPGAPVATIEERLVVARADIQAGNWSAAKAALLEAVQDQPANADVHNLLGFVYRKQAVPDLPQAFTHYRLALRFDPRHRGAHEYIGEAYLQDRQPAMARRQLEALEQICGNRTCEEYVDLAAAIARDAGGR